MLKKKYLAAGALTVPFALLLSSCSVADLTTDNYDKSESKQAATSEQGVADGLLPGWVPAGGTDVKLEQRTTGHERIFVMNYSGALPGKQCTPVKQVGKPSAKELAASYAADSRSKDWKVEDIATAPTLSADWWPAGAQEKTTDLCGRWWVHQDSGKLYAFAPDTKDIAGQVAKQRENK
ncbi:hypothetical protein AUR04nite_06790 [Glutamicibacter uratoxydans]|uniref:Lipoprotein n=1 Tax=Glutamicibacter uratoxydans TaxID=43667 RepID=A0A4Y4DKJ6_GLUUR|nr:hypothetical protein [Glutamicibacter uratoxydans]GED05147.1 hypothetical protein AUR04nite_06790 [Glutamicibacter uratoxydans]